MLLRAQSPIDHPSYKVPALSWWEGIYDHVFFALHPFVRVRKEPGAHASDGSIFEDVKMLSNDEAVELDDVIKQRGEIISWHEVHMAVSPQTPEIEFNRAVWLLSAIGYVDRAGIALQKQIAAYCERERLLLPEDSGIPAILHPRMEQFLSHFGVSDVTAWDEFRHNSMELALTALRSDQPTAFLPQSVTSSALWALHLPGPGILATCEFDGTETIIAMTAQALNLARPESYFEGFYAKADTYCDWLNPLDFFEREE